MNKSLDFEFGTDILSVRLCPIARYTNLHSGSHFWLLSWNSNANTDKHFQNKTVNINYVRTLISVILGCLHKGDLTVSKFTKIHHGLSSDTIMVIQIWVNIGSGKVCCLIAPSQYLNQWFNVKQVTSYCPIFVKFENFVIADLKSDIKWDLTRQMFQVPCSPFQVIFY